MDYDVSMCERVPGCDKNLTLVLRGIYFWQRFINVQRELFKCATYKRCLAKVVVWRFWSDGLWGGVGVILGLKGSSGHLQPPFLSSAPETKGIARCRLLKRILGLWEGLVHFFSAQYWGILLSYWIAKVCKGFGVFSPNCSVTVNDIFGRWYKGLISYIICNCG